MSIDPMQCTQDELVRLVETGKLTMDVTYDRQLVNGKDTLTIRFPKWVGRMPNCQEFLATFCAGIIPKFQGVDIRIVIGTPEPHAMPSIAVGLHDDGVIPTTGTPYEEAPPQ